MDSLSDMQTYCFADDLLPYLGAFRGKRAYALLFKGKEIPVKDWTDFSCFISAALSKYAPEWLKKNASRYGWEPIDQEGIDKDKPTLYRCPSVTNAYNAIKKLRTMLSDSGIPLADVSVVYGERSEGSRRRRGVLSGETESDREPITEELEKLEKVLARFSSGVRASSIIDQNRLRRRYVELYGEELRSDLNFEIELKKIGFEHEGKIFPRSEAAKEECLGFIRGLIAEGNRIFNFSRVMELQSSKLMPRGVFTADMLLKMIGPYALHVSVRSGQESVLAYPDAEPLCKIYRNWFAPVDGSFDLNGIVIGDLDADVAFVTEDLLCDKYKYGCSSKSGTGLMDVSNISLLDAA